MRLNYIFAFVTVVLVVLLVYAYWDLAEARRHGGGTDPEAASAALEISAIEAELDDYLNAHVGTGRFMGSALVARGDETLLSRGYGWSNLELNTRNTPATKFRIGSTTKQFTAAAILQLVEQGVLDLEAPVSTYLPNYPNGDAITVHQLLNHTAGVPNYTALPGFIDTIRLPTTLDALVSRFADEPLEFQPGEQYRYSNSGYVLLAKIVESVSGQSYDDYLRQHVLDPLAMTDTGYDRHQDVLTNRASGYEFTGEGYQNAEFVDMSFASGAGGLYSTVEDLAVWNRALTTEEVLGQPMRTLMFAPSVVVDESADPLSYYGYGWETTEHAGRSLQYHVGRLAGFVAMTARYPEEDLVTIVLSNVGGASPDVIAKDLAAIVLNEPYSAPKERVAVQINPSFADAYVGRYQLTPDLVLTVTNDDGQLFVQATDQPAFEIFAESDTEYFLKVVDAQITFELDDAGLVTGLVLHQAGRDLPAEKLDD